MMQLLHGIEQVGDQSSTGFDSLLGNPDPSGGVADGKGDVATLAFGDDGHHSGDFGGSSDDADCRRDRCRAGFEFVGAVTCFEIIEAIGDRA